MNHEIFLRCHTCILDEEHPEKTGTKKAQPLPKYVLVFDTETTTDALQSLNFGVYQFCEMGTDGSYASLEEGAFYADDLDARQLEVLRQYVHDRNGKRTKNELKLRLYDRHVFVEKVMYTAIQAGAAIVAFNLPFDLSRLAVEYRVARGAGGRGWSFVVFRYRNKDQWLPNTFRPRVQLRPKDSKAAFIRLAGGDMDQPYRIGRFLDLKTLVWALRNKSLSLESACREFKVPGKLHDYVPGGRVTSEEIDYCRQDVRATVGLLNALLAEFKHYPLGDLPPERAYSAASIAKAFLKTMGAIPPEQKFQLDDRTKGICMQGYYGGRAEIRIRHTPIPVVYTDFTSQYPTVNTLLGLWSLLTAEKVRVREATQEVQALLQTLTVDRLLDLRTWPKLAFFALIQPDGDILPVRTIYGDGQSGDQTNIGLNPLTSEKPIWFAGPDIVGSTLLKGKAPKILRAIRIEPMGLQKEMKSVMLGTGFIDPYRDDFFRKVIEERKGKQKTDPLYYFLKILANAGCYGIYAEVNKLQVGRNDAKKIEIFSGEYSGTERTCTMEVPGPWYFPPVASLITAGGRLLLAMLERMVTDAGGSYLMCDTDSMAIVASERGGLIPCNGGSHRMPDETRAVKALSWEQTRKIVDKFKTLNPYNPKIVPGSILNIVEDINRDSDGSQRQIYGYGISAKRYALYTYDGSRVKLIKASEHGLGLYYRPKEGRDSDCEVALWIKEGWEWILNRALGLPCSKPDWFRLPVMRRIAISTPNVMKALRTLDRDKSRPYNFALSPVLVNLSNQPITLLGPFEKDPARWERMPYINIHDGTTHTLNPPTLLVLPQTFGMVFSQYVRHPEYKSLPPDGTPCKADSHGLLKRYPVTACGFHLIGKETERGWEQAEDISTLTPSLVRYGLDSGIADERLRKRLLEIPLAFLEWETGLSRHTVVRTRRGQPVHPRSLRLLKMAVRKVPIKKL
jgi:DNA polymerase type B, organellar and viral